MSSRLDSPQQVLPADAPPAAAAAAPYPDAPHGASAAPSGADPDPAAPNVPDPDPAAPSVPDLDPAAPSVPDLDPAAPSGAESAPAVAGDAPPAPYPDPAYDAVPAPAPGPPREGRGPGTADPLVADLRRAGLLRLLVLHLCDTGPCYGNQLMERISGLTGGLVAVNPNTMYPLLRELEAEGLLAGEWEHPQRRSRRFYQVTPAGDAERARLLAPVRALLDRMAGTVDALRRELEA